MYTLTNRITLILLVCMATLTVQAQRVEKSMNFGWRFHAGDAVGAEKTDFDDSRWQTVNVPHDFQISQPWVEPAPEERADNSDDANNKRSRLAARGFKEMGIGWYRMAVTPPDEWKGKRVVLDFEGIMLVGDVYLNGERIGGTDYGYVGFDIDITDRLQFGKENIIAVKANTMDAADSRWYTGGGLFRDVKLVITNRDRFFTRHPLYITTPKVSSEEATVRVQAEIACRKGGNQRLSVRTVIRDGEGIAVYDSTHAINYNRKMRTCEYLTDSIALPHPNLWSCEKPHRYSLEMTLLDENMVAVDNTRTKFGIRSVAFTPEHGMTLNGKKVLLKGIANHHTLGALGAAAYPRAIEKRLELLKDFGFNHIRTSHNPYSESLLEMCDSMGIIVVDELYDKWLQHFAGGRRDWLELWQHDVPEWIKRDRNHPSVVMWSLGNELQTNWNIPFADWGVTPYRMQRELLKRYDKTRPVTVAMHPRGRSLETDSVPAPLVFETDIAAYNYRYMYFPGDHRRWPWMIFYQSEANASNMGPNFYEMDQESVVGLAYWGMIDYLGESRGWPAKGWTEGAFDISLEPKPLAYLLRSMFKPEEPTVHIGIVQKEDNSMWNGVKVGGETLVDHWNFKAGAMLNLWTYTNADAVELRINGKTIGRKQNDKTDRHNRDRIRWDNIPYAQGSIEAIGYNAEGKVVARHRIETSGKAKRLVATTDNKAWKADGTDLQHVRIMAVDGKGRRAWDANEKLQFSVEGPAEIVGVVNGDMTSSEMLTGSERSLYNGTMTVILRSQGCKQDQGQGCRLKYKQKEGCKERVTLVCKALPEGTYAKLRIPLTIECP